MEDATMKTRYVEEFQDAFARLYKSDFIGIKTRNVTFVVTEDCDLRCTYCYEGHKNCNNRMTKETGRAAIDMLFKMDEEESPLINDKNAEGIILEFIGGEPLLEIDLIDYLVEYFKYKAITAHHRWAIKYMISMTTNGIHYLDDKVQDFIKRNHGRVSVNITIDGNKELHDSCRLFPDGRGSYDIVEKAYRHYLKNNPGRKQTKLTLAPANISYLYEAAVHLFELGLDTIHSNCVFEKGWKVDHAKIMYSEMKRLADWLIDNKDNGRECTISLFDNNVFGKPLTDDNNENWCGGTGKMLAIGPNGKLYPCLRYLPFTLAKGKEPIIIGDIQNGIGATEKQKETIDMLNSITRRSQSTDECYNCPIAAGCAWCSAYNYEQTGTPNKRVTYICIMHKARVLANIYYWNKLGVNFPIHIPKEWALEIINEDEWNLLNDLQMNTVSNL
jgi:uncharacterized protein